MNEGRIRPLMQSNPCATEGGVEGGERTLPFKGSWIRGGSRERGMFQGRNNSLSHESRPLKHFPLIFRTSFDSFGEKDVFPPEGGRSGKPLPNSKIRRKISVEASFRKNIDLVRI